MDNKAITCAEDLKNRFRLLKHPKQNRVLQSITKISQWVLIILAIVFVIVFIAYNFVFQNYEVIGESLECNTNTPFKLNYICKLDVINNTTQYWSFESTFPDGFSLPHMMVSVNVNEPFLFNNTH